MARSAKPQILGYIGLLLILLIVSACNLTSAPEEIQISLTEVLTGTPPPTRTGLPTGGVPTTLPITPLSPPTSQVLQLPSTSIALPPTFVPFPTNTSAPISIVILSPIPGNVVAGNVQVIGAAIHPRFLQYQVEYGPDPNPGNLWYPATGIIQAPVINGLLGIWNTTVIQDSVYQLRLRVTLNDGTVLATVVNNIRIQNQLPTPVPSATPNIPRPIAAFTQDRTSGQAPLVVRFLNQSSGSITNYYWTFGDGSSSSEANPTYTFRNPGIYNVVLTVSGPGGASNVSQQINVQSPTAPIVAFTQDKSSGPSPLTVQFTNQSTGNITGYNWTFGDGGTSIEQNPLHQFVNVGTYNVILSVVGPGGTSFVTRKITVEDPVVPPPVAIFTANPTSGNAPLDVQLINQSTGRVTNYAWDFGDSQTSTDQNPIHSYTTAGTYTVKLTAIGPGGQNTAQVSITVNQPPDAPKAAFTPSATSGNIPLNVLFSNQSTGQITSYAWDFGDGTASSEKDPSHSYTAAGTYTVKLTVTGPGGSSEAQATINALQPVNPPIAKFVADPTTGNPPLTVQFTNQSTGDNLTYKWNFGDGSAESNEANPSHVYDNPGAYTVVLTASNSAGNNNTQSIITVSTLPLPVAAFTADPVSGTKPLEVTFTNTSTGDITGYQWTFGDGGTSTEANPVYTFNTAGTYAVQLIVTGPGGNSLPVTQTITVSEVIPPPVAAFTADPVSGTKPLEVTFTNTSTGDIAGYQWTFGDGGTSTETNPVYMFNAAGSYEVELKASGPGGESLSVQTITVSEPISAPVASFTADPLSGAVPLTVQFTNTSIGDITGYVWKFGDGTESSEANPLHAFNSFGDYVVELTVSGPGGNSVPFTQTISVTAPAPVAAFEASPMEGVVPLTVQFTSTSTGDITVYNWTFGDGGVSNEPNPLYSYAVAGTYTAQLFVSGPGGDSLPFTQTITVTEQLTPLVAAFTADPSSGVAPLSVQFTNSSTGDIAVYNWTFGDGGTSTEVNPLYIFNSVGTYTVELIVTGSDGSTSSATQTVIVDGGVITPTINGPIAFVTNRDGNDEIYVRDTSGSITNITNNFASDRSPAWSPDGTSIVFVSDRDGNNEIYSMNADGSNVIRLTDNSADDNSPVWSNNGRSVIFVSNRDGNNEVYIFNLDDSSLVNLTNDPSNDVSPQQSPDGSKIVFMSDREGNNDIYILNTSDGIVTNISNNPNVDASPSWSPSGNQIIFVSDRDFLAQIYVMNADGSNVQRLSDGSSPDTDPTISPDNSQIVFVSQREGFSQLYVMGIDGNNPGRISDGQASEDSPTWKP